MYESIHPSFGGGHCVDPFQDVSCVRWCDIVTRIFNGTLGGTFRFWPGSNRVGCSLTHIQVWSTCSAGTLWCARVKSENRLAPATVMTTTTMTTTATTILLRHVGRVRRWRGRVWASLIHTGGQSAVYGVYTVFWARDFAFSLTRGDRWRSV